MGAEWVQWKKGNRQQVAGLVGNDDGSNGSRTVKGGGYWTRFQ